MMANTNDANQLQRTETIAVRTAADFHSSSGSPGHETLLPSQKLFLSPAHFIWKENAVPGVCPLT